MVRCGNKCKSPPGGPLLRKEAVAGLLQGLCATRCLRGPDGPCSCKAAGSVAKSTTVPRCSLHTWGFSPLQVMTERYRECHETKVLLRVLALRPEF